jgi:glucose/mannose-6-phosphate isomerase
MDTMISRFTEQLKESLQIGERSVINASKHPIHNIYVAGLGGSGIGANFVAEFHKSELKIPFIIGKGYEIPAFINENTLAIASSYSGNTEETLNSFAALQKTGAKIIVVSSGGKLIQYAKENKYDYIQVPSNWDSPRACLGYSLVQQMFILYKLGLTNKQAIQNIESSIPLLDREEADIKTMAKSIAEQLFQKIPVIYTTDRMESVAVRFRQQVNENAKMLAWHHVIPEMNHNELVGWREEHNNLAVIYFRNEDDYSRNRVRIDINKKIISEYTDTIIELYSKGNNLVERNMYFVYLGDWISWYLSQLRGVDSVEVKVIDYLKGELSKV